MPATKQCQTPMLVSNQQKGQPMYKAILTFRDSHGDYVRTVEDNDQSNFYAILAGTIQGNMNCGSHLIAMERNL